MISYGEGNLILSSNEKMIEIKYDGAISITERSDGIIIDANRNKLSIYMADGEYLPELIFEYKGIFKIDSVYSIENGRSSTISTTVLGSDFWKDGSGTYSRDTSLWGAIGTNYKVGFPQRYNPTQFDNIIKRNPSKNRITKFSSDSNKTNQFRGTY
mgnify:CR=1 FL=1